MTAAMMADAALSAPAVSHQRPKNAQPLRLITCGSVDDGKSTLIGRLLWDTRSVKDDQAATLMNESGGSQNTSRLPDFARLLDGLQAEREQGITIDVAYRYFSTATRTFIVADTPGHEQYTRNMATGASSADLAVLLVDARVGILEQTRRHATIVALMGIRQIVLAVNKMDLAGYDRAAFEAIAGAFRELAFSLGVPDVTAIPVSALKGENIVAGGVGSMPWYRGPTLIQKLDHAAVHTEQAGGFRFPVQRVTRPDETFRGYQGTVAGGTVKPGDRVTVLPSGQTATVRKIVTFDLERNAAVPGDAVTLVLDRAVDIARGDLLVDPTDEPMAGREFEARLVVLSADGVTPGRPYWLKSGARLQRVRVKPKTMLDLASGRYEAVDRLPLNGIGTIGLMFEETAIFDRYDQNRTTGAFILIDPETRNTIAGGMITSRPPDMDGPERSDPVPRVLLSMPPDLAEKVLHWEEVAGRRDEIEIVGG